MKRMWTALALIAMLTTSVGVAAAPAFGSGAAAQAEKVAVFIAFARQPGPAEEALVRRAGGAIKYTYHLVPAIAASLPEAAINGLLANPNVTRIEPDGEVWAIDAELDNTWGVKRIGGGIVHDGGNKGAGVKVAVLDTGIDTDHPDLSYNPNCSESFVEDETLEDGNGHGTHTTGTIAALDNGAGVVGVAPEATLCIYKVLSDSGSGSYSDVIAALERAVVNGVQVTNNSYGSPGDPGVTVKTAFDIADAAGVVNVCAAGNSGNPPGRGDNVIYPARYESCIAVAATERNDNRARFSSTGLDVELAGPGVDINSTVLGGGYGEKSGTSMASPHVAGTAALVIAAGIADANDDGNINDEVRQRLQETADDLGDPGRDTKFGYGLVDADEAAASAPPPVNNPPSVSITSPVDGSTFVSGATILFEGTASDTEDEDGALTASLVWTSDLDGSIGTGGSFSTTLTDGNHTITAEVTDSGGKTGSATRSITVGTPPAGPTTVSVSSIDYDTEGGKNKDKHLLITVALRDDLGNPVAGASVSIDLFRDDSFVASGTGTTGTDGTVTFSLKNAPAGDYTTTVTGVTADGLTWDGETPENGFPK